MSGSGFPKRLGFPGMEAGSAFFAVATLAIVVAAALPFFSLVNGVLWRPLPYPQPQQLALLWETSPQWSAQHSDRLAASYLNFQDWRSSAGSFKGMAAFFARTLRLDTERFPIEILSAAVSEDFFSVLGRDAAHGRVLSSSDHPDGDVVVLTDGLGRRLFGDAQTALGREIRLGQKPYTVVGVMPSDFQFGSFRSAGGANWAPVEAWTPLNGGVRQVPRNTRFLQVVARLKPGIEMSSARQEIEAIGNRLAQEFPESNGGATLSSLHAELTGSHRDSLLLLMAGALALLLIALSNLAHLVVTLTMKRRAEFAVRQAVGASPWQVFSQLLKESSAVAVAGCSLGLILAFWSLDLLVAAVPDQIPRRSEIQLNSTEVLFLVLVALVALLLLSLIPFLKVKKSRLLEALRPGFRSTAVGGKLLAAFAVLQLILIFALVHAGSLLLITFWNFEKDRPGFRREGVQLIQAALPRDRYSTPAMRREFVRQALQRLNDDPRVTDAAASSSPPLGTWSSGSIHVEGIDAHRGAPPTVNINSVTPGFFSLLGIELLKGRSFDRRHNPDGFSPAIVNERAARLFEGRNPIGRRLRVAGKWRTVVGVVSDARFHDLKKEPEPDVFLPLGGEDPFRIWFFSVAAGDFSLLEPLRALEPEILAGEPRALAAVISESYSESRFRAAALAVLGLAGVLLAAVGVYSPASHLVQSRRREFGVRLALGSTGRRLLNSVLLRSLGLSLAGILGGLACSVPLNQTLSALVFGVRAANPLVAVGVAVFALLLAGSATLVAARGLLSLDPAVVLRQE